MAHVAFCSYHVRSGGEARFLKQLRKHRPALERRALVTSDRHDIFRGLEDQGRTFFVEVLSWRDKEGPTLAEHFPDVLKVWEAMGKLCEARGGRPAMEFSVVEDITKE